MTKTDGRRAARAAIRRRAAARPGAARIAVAAVLVLMASAAWGAWGALPAAAAAQPAGQPPIEEFVPIDELPEEDRLPAAPFLIAAYSVVWLLALGYFWSLARRFTVVERDLADLKRRSPDPDGGDG